VCLCKADDNQKKADRLYELKMRELDERACELQHAEEECRKAINEATKSYNVAQVSSLLFVFFSFPSLLVQYTMLPLHTGFSFLMYSSVSTCYTVQYGSGLRGTNQFTVSLR